MLGTELGRAVRSLYLLSNLSSPSLLVSPTLLILSEYVLKNLNEILITYKQSSQLKHCSPWHLLSLSGLHLYFCGQYLSSVPFLCFAPNLLFSYLTSPHLLPQRHNLSKISSSIFLLACIFNFVNYLFLMLLSLFWNS